MASSTWALLALLIFKSCSANVRIYNYVVWEKLNLSTNHTVCVDRLFKDENLVNEAAREAVTSVSEGLNDSLSMVVKYLAEELDIMQAMVEGTDAEGCLQGISNNLDKAIEQAIDDYEHCADDAMPQLERLRSRMTAVAEEYQQTYEKTLLKANECQAKTLRKDRLLDCMEEGSANYWRKVEEIQARRYQRSKDVFLNKVVQCAQEAMYKVVNDGDKQLENLARCIQLNGNKDFTEYSKKLADNFYSHIPDSNLRYQVDHCRNSYNGVLETSMALMKTHIRGQMDSLLEHKVEPQTEQNYTAEVTRFLQYYLDRAALASSREPGSSQCAGNATANLLQLITTGAKKFQCHETVMNQTLAEAEALDRELVEVTAAVVTIGDAAIIDCFREGFIFAENAITDCYHHKSYEFYIRNKKLLSDFRNNVEGICKVNSMESIDQCHHDVMEKIEFKAKTIMYEMRRCLYVSSGTIDYIVRSLEIDQFHPNEITNIPSYA